MFIPLFSLGVIGVILILSEWLWHKKIITGEISRKFVHILVGVLIATWPFYMNFDTIRLLILALFTGIYISKRLAIFKSIHNVERKTWGELFFPLGIGAVTLLTDSPWIFAAAVLHLSLADGLAAIVGTKLRYSRGYMIFKQKKSVAGTATFWLTSVLIVTATLIAIPSDPNTAWKVLVILPLAAAILENISIYGTDDITVPVAVAAALNALI